jgi:very-short-patch-repair endonuclease
MPVFASPPRLEPSPTCAPAWTGSSTTGRPAGALDLNLISRSATVPDTALTRSELEKRFLRFCRRHRLPQPAVNARVGRYEVDFLWRQQRVVVETDGFEHHGTRDAFERDRARDADLQARGYRVLRITHRQLRDDGRQVALRVRRLLKRPAIRAE